MSPGLESFPGTPREGAPGRRPGEPRPHASRLSRGAQGPPDDEPQAAQLVREAHDLRVDEAEGQRRLSHVVLGELLAALRPEDPDLAVGANRFHERREPRESRAVPDGGEDRVASLPRPPAGHLGGARREVREERSVIDPEDRDARAQLDAELVEKGTPGPGLANIGSLARSGSHGGPGMSSRHERYSIDLPSVSLPRRRGSP